MRVGYARSKSGIYGMSKNGQLWKLRKCEKIFLDEDIRLETHRPQFKKCIDSLRPGDVLVVCSLQSLATSLIALMKIIRHCRQLDIQIRVLDQDINRDTLEALELAGEYQEAINQEKRGEGIERAKRNNVAFGRPVRISDDIKQKVIKMKNTGFTVKQIIEQMNISKTSYYRIVKEIGNSNVSMIVPHK
ncbi:recombinase family protein [Algicola sagamiensis]|uniref:recombinase family protein n=1 Tax=Algicola sagamiensis TaxID=163869 RepID=UPI00036238FE|nr:recombinase family protein [Algicola sagamiensis]